MRLILSTFLFVALTLAGTALAQQSSPFPMTSPTPSEPPQMGQTLQETEPAQSALPTRTFEGRVKAFTNNTVTLVVAGDEVKLKASKLQTAQLQKGKTVQVQARPSLEAQEVQLLQGAFAGDQLIGTIETVQKNSFTVRTSEGSVETVRIGEKAADKLRSGQQVVVQLKEDPRRAKDWQATDIQPIRSSM